MTKYHLVNQTMALNATSMLFLNTFRMLLSEQAIPVSNHPFCEEIFPNVQFNQLEAMSSRPFAGSSGD